MKHKESKQMKNKTLIAIVIPIIILLVSVVLFKPSLTGLVQHTNTTQETVTFNLSFSDSDEYNVLLNKTYDITSIKINVI